MRYNIGTKKVKKKSKKTKLKYIKIKPLIYKGFSVFVFDVLLKRDYLSDAEISKYIT
jgi:hypothetical protein